MTNLLNLSGDKEITEALDTSLDKLQSTASQDTKILTDMNNSLSWILTITALIFGFTSR